MVRIISQIRIFVNPFRYSGKYVRFKSPVMRSPDRSCITIVFVHIGYIRIINIHEVRVCRFVIPFEIGFCQVERVGIGFGMVDGIVHD